MSLLHRKGEEKKKNRVFFFFENEGAKSACSHKALDFSSPPSKQPRKQKLNMSDLADTVSAGDYKPSVILITGAAGFIGSHTALRLVRNLPDVRVRFPFLRFLFFALSLSALLH